VRLDAGGGEELMLLLEVKGQEDEQDRAKYAGAQKWIRAVNHHGEFGKWTFYVCRDPNQLGSALSRIAASSGTPKLEEPATL